MANRWKNTLNDRDVTPETPTPAPKIDRRSVIGGIAGAGLVGGAAGLGWMGSAAPAQARAGKLTPNSWEEITEYNNFYEFGTDKTDPARYAGAMTTSPWTVKIDGMVDKPGNYTFEDIQKRMTIEQRIYRFRCVEAWSRVVPWDGFELADLLNLAGVQARAKYVAFETLYRPDEMRGQRRPTLPWPYVEGLRMDEAMHPLTLMATGIYGRDLPNQNGAPLRLVVPWKYGFKSIKSVVRITATDKQPPTTWNTAIGREYGFYSNVNPEVDHPRWSQGTERVIGGGLLSKRIPTLKFNGYEKEVAGLYGGMDLRKFY